MFDRLMIMDYTNAKTLKDISSFASPQLLSNELYLKVDGPLGDAFPLNRVQKGSSLVFHGICNSGVTSTVFEFLSSGDIKKNWCALVGFEGLGFLSAFEKGVDLERIVLVSNPGRDVARVVAILLEAFPVVVIFSSRFVSSSQARNLVSRVRVRKSIMIIVWHDANNGGGFWPSLSDYVIQHSMPNFYGLGHGNGFIKERCVTISLRHKRHGGTQKRVQIFT